MSIFVVGSTKNKFLSFSEPRKRFYVDQPHIGLNADKWNPWWCEITGLFYMWQHQDNSAWYGIEHYRRYFSDDNGQLLDDQMISDRLRGQDILLYRNPASCAYHDMCVTGKKAEIDLACRLVNELFGHQFGEFFSYRIKQKNTCEGNMFIASKDVLNWYCPALFKLLTRFDVIHGFRIPRITGYIAEYFMGPWIEYNKLNICWSSRIAYDKNLTHSVILRSK